MQLLAPLKRTNVSQAVADTVRRLIVSGELAEGERINEVRLSQQLGVSRTPLREALNRLSSEGDLGSRPSLGYFVNPLTLEEFEPLYAMRPILDPAALRLAGLPSAERLRRLDELNERIEACDGVEQVLALDDEWHLELVGDCGNPILLDLIGRFIRRTRRYDLALMREQGQLTAATSDHCAVLAALRGGDLEGGCEALRRNLTRGAEPIRAWLSARKPKGEVR